MNRPTITVSPAAFHRRLHRVFTLLEEALDVRFLAGEQRGRHDGTPAIVFHDGNDIPPEIPPSTLVYLVDPRSEPVAQEIVFSRDVLLDRRFHGRALSERSLPPLRPLPADRSTVLASGPRGPVWTVRERDHHRTDIVRLGDTGPGLPISLWDNFQEHRFFLLLTLVHFLRTAIGRSGWTPPPLRAALVVDDPNLRTMKYGGFDFRSVAGAARRHRFHMSVGVAPIDLARTSPAVAAFVRDHTDVLSLAIHGNNHLHHELLRTSDEAEALAMACDILRKVERFELRHHIPVSRVVVPPNEVCSETFLRALSRLPFNAVVTTRPFPWLPPDSWNNALGGDDGLRCWHPADFVAGGFPVIRRSAIPNNMVYRAFLDQPVIRYSHHDAFIGDMERVLEAAQDINSLGDVTWMSLDDIARGNCETRIDGETLLVRPFARSVSVEVPAGAAAVQVVLPGRDWEGNRIVVNGVGLPAGCGEAGPVAVRPGSPVAIQIVRRDAVDYSNWRGRRPSFRAWAHRRTSEVMDRLGLR
jgi:hypothetical protein